MDRRCIEVTLGGGTYLGLPLDQAMVGHGRMRSRTSASYLLKKNDPWTGAIFVSL
jgi:hypothetical protein